MDSSDFGFFAGLLPLLLVFGGTIGKLLYNLYLHPLRSYPGPFLARATRLYHIYWDLKGVSHLKIKELHDQYGEVVRIAPNELSYNTSQAWRDIYGHKNSTKTKEFEKDMTFFTKSLNGATNILIANQDDHRRMRRLLSHAFSEKALRGQEALLTRYVDLMIAQLRKRAAATTGPNGGDDDGVVDLVSWYNFATFDIIGDLAFGEPFGCLRDGIWHRWIRNIFSSLKAANYVRAARRFPSPLKEMLFMFLPRSLMESREYQFRFARERARTRMAQGSGREDFMSYILRANDEKGMTPDEIEAASSILIIAGSETTATLLSGATYLLLKNPKALETLKREIRSSFRTEKDINFQSVAQLPYLHAVLEESLRLYPPVPSTFPRTTPAPGEIVCGRFVPEKTSVGVHQWATYRSERNFRDANSFIPERWLDNDARFADDDKKAFQPFSYGPRNCLGKK
ncbi:Cytochrome P450 [Rasamsonia emersonii CBS 393.64]|uniref:Cytochrome P450 n=1 Tax=Rasamsonia emersonii (strain ATCC 16479 / CBS 393.64 / IMI 116815) TaxID=1408163 RepID=A0A0F4YQ01_RASE3|nr:Cytochrome P450 [Rasamsonia emersonii CBS 393.64]KKA20160.1 Cytochrome P450 [Rasamsonia emersonii CBS 393.64]